MASVDEVKLRETGGGIRAGRRAGLLAGGICPIRALFRAARDRARGGGHG
jgi:hypothetical protein